ncbi:hypothetical protein [Nocardia sp. NPDC051750]|uniref:hypothetical protein n=1 Tax=Nocardia sp. NPDC051750 TaxID=3364325 RepID=UPI00379647C5
MSRQAVEPSKARRIARPGADSHYEEIQDRSPAEVDGVLASAPRRAAEVVVRAVLSQVLIPDSGLTDEELARTAARARTR